MTTEYGFLTADETLSYMLRICFTSGQLSPQILHEASGVDIDTCIDFCAKNLSEMMFNKPPKIGGNKIAKKKNNGKVR